jgi:hypothetical protein
MFIYRDSIIIKVGDFMIEKTLGKTHCIVCEYALSPKDLKEQQTICTACRKLGYLSKEDLNFDSR